MATKQTEEAAELVATNTQLSTDTGHSLGFTAQDIDIPRINLVQKMSQMDAPVGSIVLDKKHVLAAESEPLEVIVMAAQKGMREDIPFDEEEVPRIAWTDEQVAKLEADTQWGLIEFAEITLLVKQPEGNTDDDAFPLPIGDSNYAIGRINTSKNAYRSTYKRLATFAAFNRSVPLNSRVWSFVSETLSKGKYTWHNPSLTITKTEVPEEVAEFISSFGL